MVRRVHGELTYANVVSTVALFLVLGGGAAYAAAHLAKNSVGTKQLKQTSVTTSKIKNAAVTSEKLASGSVGAAQLQANSITGGNVQAGSLTGSDINQSTLTSVRASNVMGVVLSGNCAAVVPFPAGVSATIAGTGCKITFPSNVYDCAVTATAAIRTSFLFIAEERRVETFRTPTTPDEIVTNPTGGGTQKEEPIDLIVVC